MSGAPENDATDTNVSGWRAAYVVDPKPPWDRPATARPFREAIVRRLASIHGISWLTWKVSHCDGPSAVAVSYQLVNQPPPLPLKPASGITVIKSTEAVAASGSPGLTQAEARPLVPGERDSTGERAVVSTS